MSIYFKLFLVLVTKNQKSDSSQRFSLLPLFGLVAPGRVRMHFRGLSSTGNMSEADAGIN